MILFFKDDFLTPRHYGHVRASRCELSKGVQTGTQWVCAIACNEVFGMCFCNNKIGTFKGCTSWANVHAANYKNHDKNRSPQRSRRRA
jgi:hypothetical protein